VVTVLFLAVLGVVGFLTIKYVARASAPNVDVHLAACEGIVFIFVILIGATPVL
jgi:hypothetical protein